jgi:hypothetical protein
MLDKQWKSLLCTKLQTRNLKILSILNLNGGGKTITRG